jgi:plastocyanin
MTGKIQVVKDSVKIPTPAQVTSSGQAALTQLAGKLNGAATALQTGTIPGLVPTAVPDQVIAGSGDPNIQNAQINQFGPPNISVPVGGSVTWLIVGPHTISFNAPASAEVVLAKAPDGSAHVNPQTAAPAGGPGQPPPPTTSGPPPTGPPPPPTVVNAGSWDGTGFHSSGIFLSFPPDLYAYKLSFTKAGSYAYQCLIHPGMKGTVKVG